MHSIVVPNNPLSIGRYESVGVLSGSAGRLTFSIPTGRVYPSGTTISKLTCRFVARASNASGGGLYIVKKTSGGADEQSFDSTSNFTFYNGANQSKTLSTSNITVTMQGNTNILVNLDAGTDHFFSGSSANTGNTNNNAATIEIFDIVVYLNIPQ